MKYRASILASPKLFLLFIIILILPPAGIFVLLNINILTGIIVLGAALYLDYHLIKFSTGYLKSYIETDDSVIKCLTMANEKFELTWDSITHAGNFTENNSKPGLFIYDSKEDKLLKISRGYSDFERLSAEIRNNTKNFQQVLLSRNQTLEEQLKEIVR